MPTGDPLPSSLNVPGPYVCPKCNGEGTEDGSKRAFNPTVLNCWPCNGTGLVWRK